MICKFISKNYFRIFTRISIAGSFSVLAGQVEDYCLEVVAVTVVVVGSVHVAHEARVAIGSIPSISLSRSLAIVVTVVAVSLHRSVPHVTRVHGPVVSRVHHVHHGPVVGFSLGFSIGLSLGFSLSLSLRFSSGLSLRFSLSRPLAIVVAVVSLLHTISVPHVPVVHVVHVVHVPVSVHVPVVTTVGAVVGISISSGFSLSRSLAIVVTMVHAPHVTGVHGPVGTIVHGPVITLGVLGVTIG